jgi:hypothetical protein
MSRFLLALGVLSMTSWAHAQRFQPILQPVGLAEKIVITGYKGILQIVPTDSETLKVEAEKIGKGSSAGWTFEVRQKTNFIEVRVKNSLEQEGWNKLTQSQEVPSFQMKVTAPMRPLEIFWHEGQVFTDQWKSDLTLQMTQGKVKLTKGEGNIRLQLLDGRLEVSEQVGAVALQTYKGETRLSKNKGSLVVNNHSARVDVTEQEGPVEFQNHSGTLSIKKQTGTAVVRNVNGAVVLREFSGSFEGDFSKGSLDAKVDVFQNFRVTSDEAAVTLDVPKESGASVHLRTEKGRLWAPIYLQKLKKGRWVERKGRLKGKEQGNIKIVSKYGDIVIK